MAIQHSALRFPGLLISSVVALALAFGCSGESTPSDDDDDGGTNAGGKGGAANTAGTGTAKGGSSGSSAGSSPTAGTPGSSGSSSGNTSAGGSAGTTGGVGTAGTLPAAGNGGGPGGAGAGGVLSNAGSAGSATAGDGNTAGSGGSDPGGNPYNPDFEEFTGKDCEFADPTEKNNSKLPDLFQNIDGTRMATKAAWSCRRAELKKIVEKFIHGEKPGRPETVTGTVSASSISVHVEHMGKSADFSVSISIPSSAKKPAPIIIGLGSGVIARDILTEEGIASGSYNNSQLASETSRNGIFTDIYGSTGASAQVAWAWGISRVIDVLVDEKAAGRNDLIDPTAVGVTGCSRLGKGAFTIGAFDERIALGIPQESGTGGVSAFRIVNTNPMGPNGKPAQSLSSAWTEAQGWFGTVFGEYRSKVDVIPGDTHSLVAMYAPRGLLVLDNSRIGELGSSAQHAASAAGALVYKALGAEKSITYHGGRAMDPHMHCSFYEEQAEPLRKAIRAHLTRTEAPDGAIMPQPAGTADLTKWIDWDAPVLE